MIKLTSSGIQFNVPSIADLPISGLEDGLSCICNDPANSGIFYYDSLQSAVNNGSTIINGWVKHVTSGSGSGSGSGTMNHTELLNIGTNTHAQIDTALTRLAGTSGSNTGDQDLSGKQDILISASNIKTINGVSVLGSGDLTVTGATSPAIALTFSAQAKVLELVGETSAERMLYLGNKRFVIGTEGTAKIYTSDDYGTTWVDRGRIGGTTTQLTIFRMANIGNGVVMAGTSPNGKLWRSTNYGTTFTEVIYGGGTDVSDLRGIAHLGNGVVVVATTCSAGAAIQSATVFRSTDYGVTFTKVYNGSATVGMLSCWDMKYLGNGVTIAVIGSGYDGASPYGAKVLRSTNYGLTWSVSHTFTEAVGSILEIGAFQDGRTIMFINYGESSGTTNGKMLYSDDYGKTWESNGQPITPTGSTFRLNGTTFIDEYNVLVGTHPGCDIYHSGDKGITWTFVSDISDSTNNTVYCFAASEAGHLIAGTYPELGAGVGKVHRLTFSRDIDVNTSTTSSVVIDELISHLSIVSLVYNTDGMISEVIYTGGYKVLYTYVLGTLSTVKYADTDGITILLTETLTYVNGNLSTITRS